jgi:hypothetical protein
MIDKGLHLVLQVLLFVDVHGVILILVVFDETVKNDVWVDLM